MGLHAWLWVVERIDDKVSDLFEARFCLWMVIRGFYVILRFKQMFYIVLITTQLEVNYYSQLLYNNCSQ